MNPQWNTPPNGDFAAYVERLTAQSAQAMTAASAPRAPHAMHEEERDGVPAPPVAQPATTLPASPGQQIAHDHPLARGLMAALLALREKLEQNLSVPPKYKQK